MAGLVALIVLFATLTLNPFLILGFTFLEVLLPIAVVCFFVVAVASLHPTITEFFEPGDVIFEEGTEGRHLYLIKKGRVELLKKNPEGAFEVVSQLSEGQRFGYAAIFHRLHRIYTARAAGKCEVVKMTPAGFFASVEPAEAERILQFGAALTLEQGKPNQ
ncbi:MAG: cyclic nucleotide-binding domain-containing protein [Candidatus Binataceae bacterium]